MKLKNIFLILTLVAFAFSCSDSKDEKGKTDNQNGSDSLQNIEVQDSLDIEIDSISEDNLAGFDLSKFANDNLSYAFGVFIGLPLKDLGLTNLVVSEMKASYIGVQKGKKLKYDLMEVQTTLRKFFQEVNAKKDLSGFDMEKVSYCMGFDIGQKTMGILPLVTDQLFKGMSDALIEKATVSADDAKKKIEQFNTEIEAVNKKIENAFLTWIKTQDGVKSTASGLLYKVIKEGKGKIPTKTSTVKTHYTGTFLNGNIFDSSYKRNEPIEFVVTGVIPGWTEALQLMPTGSKWELYIPANLAYGNSPNPSIPPGSTLKFEIELLSFK